ncbi:MAG: GTP-binding protein [Myxococcota bacterium]
MSTASPRIPALVVSGFLGSGKTTLVRHLLACAQASGTRVAIVSNEIGELGVDRALLGGGGEAFVELEGGCVCCELSDDLVTTLQELYERVRPDRIVVETSGAALPFDTQLNFWREPVSAWMGDDAAVVVVNAEQLLEGRDLEGAFEDQVHSADLLVLNKVDLVPGGEPALAALEAKLAAIEPEAPIVRAVQGRVDPDVLFPPDAGRVDRAGPAPAHEAHAHHHDAFATRVWRVPAALARDALERELAAVPGLVRAKGFVALDGALHVVQVVGRRVEIEPSDAAPPAASIGALVLITRAA